MGQREIEAFLKRKRRESERYYSSQDIREELRREGYAEGILKGVTLDLFKLAAFERIEFIGVGLLEHRKLFRGKKD